MRNPFKLFFVPIIQLFSKFYLQLPRPSPSAETVDSEMVAPLAARNGAKKQDEEAGLLVVPGRSQKFLFGGPNCSTNIFIKITSDTHIHIHAFLLYTHTNIYIYIYIHTFFI